jgi:hypothetical protein
MCSKKKNDLCVQNFALILSVKLKFGDTSKQSMHKRNIIGPLGRPDVIFRKVGTRKTSSFGLYIIREWITYTTPNTKAHTNKKHRSHKTTAHKSFEVTNSTKQARTKSSR